MCAEDNVDCSDLMTSFLRQIGYEVIVATTCAESFELIERHKFVLYILDSRLKDGTCAELCRRIRLEDEETPILMYSGDGFKGEIAAAIAAGANDYVVKPDWNKLLRSVQKLAPVNQPVNA